MIAEIVLTKEAAGTNSTTNYMLVIYVQTSFVFKH